jgi:hypothetical protein
MDQNHAIVRLFRRALDFSARYLLIVSLLNQLLLQACFFRD